MTTSHSIDLMMAVQLAINSFGYHAQSDKDERERSLENVRRAVSAGGDPSLLCGNGVDATTAIIMSSANGDSETLAILLKSPLANVNIVDGGGDTALLMAAQNEYPLNISLLLDAGACGEAQDADGLTPLMASIRAGCYESCSILARRTSWNWLDADFGKETLRKLALAQSNTPSMANIMHLLTSIMDERILQESCPPSLSRTPPTKRSL